MTVKILNPIAGGATHIGVKRAIRFIKSGRAEIVGECLRFIEDHHARQAALKSSQGRHTAGGYDRVRRRITLEEMSNIPIISPREMVAPIGRLIPRPRRMSVAQVNQPYIGRPC